MTAEPHPHPKCQGLYQDALGWKRAGYKVFSIDVDELIEILETSPDKSEQEIRDLKYSLDFYKTRCDNLQKEQSTMRDPERQIVCDILANGHREKWIEELRSKQGV